MALSRRRVLLGGAAAVVIAGGAWMGVRRRASSGSGWPVVGDGQPLLRMPFPAGAVVLCQQGNVAREGLTHALSNCLHALDLSNSTERALPVVAAAPGKVVFAFGEAALEDARAGLRFGNQVKVQHDNGYFTFYAHLARVSVQAGDVVRAAGEIGTVGRTGAAGNAHLHFSLHHGAPQGLGVHETTSMLAVVSADLSEDGVFVERASIDFRAGETEPWQGHLYSSENDGDGPITKGEPAEALREKLTHGHVRLETAVRDRNTLAAVSGSWEQDGAGVVDEVLRPILARDPSQPVARLWLARAVLIPTGAHDRAERELLELLRDGPALPTWETWLPSWIHNQLGLIAMKRGRRGEADEHFRLAYRSAVARPERRFALEHLRDLADAGP